MECDFGKTLGNDLALQFYEHVVNNFGPENIDEDKEPICEDTLKV